MVKNALTTGEISQLNELIDQQTDPTPPNNFILVV